MSGLLRSKHIGTHHLRTFSWKKSEEKTQNHFGLLNSQQIFNIFGKSEQNHQKSLKFVKNVFFRKFVLLLSLTNNTSDDLILTFYCWVG